MLIPPLPPSLEKELFALALEFRLAMPWLSISNAHYLFVGQAGTGYNVLTVLGEGEERYGMQSYGGAAALRFIHSTESFGLGPLPDPGELIGQMLELDGVELELTSKTALSLAEKELATRQGYKPIRGMRQAWPALRQFRPGYLQGPLDELYARRLLQDLRRALRWTNLASSLSFEGDRSIYLPLKERWVPSVSPDLPTDRAWSAADITWIPVPPSPEFEPEPVPMSDLVVEALRTRRSQPAQGVWIVDERLLPQMLSNSPRGLRYFPRHCMIFDGETGAMVAQGIAVSHQPLGSAAAMALQSRLNNPQRARPEQVVFAQPQVSRALRNWLPSLACPIAVLNEPIPELEAFWQGLCEMM